MKRIVGAFLVGAAAVALAAMASPDVTLDVKGVHICCPVCEKAIGKVLETAGVKGTCSKDTKMVSITAADNAAAQKALDALAAAGFHGDTGNKDLAIKDDSGAKAGKVASLKISGAHNCCPACCKAIKAVVAKVEGVASDDCAPKAAFFTVKGNFDAAKLVKALNDAGLHVKAE